MENPPSEDQDPKSIGELRQALIRVLQSDFGNLQDNIQNHQKHISQLEAFVDSLPGDLDRLRDLIKRLSDDSSQLKQQILGLQSEFTEPEKFIPRLSKVIGPAMVEGVDQDPDTFTEAIAPIISPAIRNQIRNSRPEMIAALYPIIGQAIGKAIAEAFQELRNSIDTRLKQNFNLRHQISRSIARLRGISETDLLLSESLPFKIQNVFLIHKKTGLLLQQLSLADEIQDLDMISAMLTAIRDFVKDAFGAEDHDLEEVQYGSSRILIKTGHLAYVAVVLDGIEPTGYKYLINDTAQKINLDYEKELHHFSGEMAKLPDFEPYLSLLLNPPSAEEMPKKEFSRWQKIALSITACLVLVTLALTIFACVFTVRLLPVAFASPTHTPTLTATPLPTSTPTLTPTSSPTNTLTCTPSPTFTISPSPTITLTPLIPKAVIIGNVWVYQEPAIASKRYLVPALQNTVVDILAVYGNWFKIGWTTDFGTFEGWVAKKWVGLTTPVPEQIITPEK